MSNALEQAVARLERALQHGLHIDLNEFNDPGQAEAHAKRLEADQTDQQKQLDKAAKAEEAAV
jgi:hypothetical protein